RESAPSLQTATTCFCRRGLTNTSTVPAAPLGPTQFATAVRTGLEIRADGPVSQLAKDGTNMDPNPAPSAVQSCVLGLLAITWVAVGCFVVSRSRRPGLVKGVIAFAITATLGGAAWLCLSPVTFHNNSTTAR